MKANQRQFRAFAESKNIGEWAADKRNIHGLSDALIRSRVRANWTMERILSTPRGKHRPCEPNEPDTVTLKPARSGVWSEVEAAILDILRLRNDTTDDYRREITNLRRLTYLDGFNPGPYSADKILDWLKRNKRANSLKGFDCTLAVH